MCHSSSASISEDLDFYDDTHPNEKTTELAAQLDYLRRMSRYETTTDIDQNEEHVHIEDTSIPLSSPTPSDSLISSSCDPRESSNIDYRQISSSSSVLNQHSSQTDLDKKHQRVLFQSSPSTASHCHSAYDFHDEEKTKLVRSPEFYNIEGVNTLTHRSLINSTIQYRTLSESALTVDEFKRGSTAPTSQETSDEFLTIISIETSSESIQHRHPTPYEDAMEKESSPEHSESSHIPSSAFSDALEPTSSCRRPLAIHPGSNRESNFMEEQLQTVANDLVTRVIDDIVRELNEDQDDSPISSSHDEFSRPTSSSSDPDDEDEDDRIPEEDEEEQLINRCPQPEIRPRVSMQKILRRAQTDTDDFYIQHSPIHAHSKFGRRNSQSDTEAYFSGISPPINEYFPNDFDAQPSSFSVSNKNAFEYGHVLRHFDSLSMVNCLQDGILRQNLQSAVIDSQSDFVNRSFVDAISTETEIQHLINDMLDSINDDLSISISSEPLSSHSDATTVIFISKKPSAEDGENQMMISTIDNSHDYSMDSSRSVITAQTCLVDPLPSVNNDETQSNSMPSLIPTYTFDDSNTKRNFHSYPGSFGDC